MTISELKVLKSAAGYYVGRSCTEDDEPGFPMPYSRESGYFPTREAAEGHLKTEGGDRQCDENDFAKEKGLLP